MQNNYVHHAPITQTVIMPKDPTDTAQEEQHLVRPSFVSEMFLASDLEHRLELRTPLTGPLSRYPHHGMSMSRSSAAATPFAASADACVRTSWCVRYRPYTWDVQRGSQCRHGASAL